MLKYLNIFLPLFLISCLVIFGVYWGGYSSSPYSRFQNEELAKGRHKKITFHYQEIGQGAGLNHIHRSHIPHPDRSEIKEFSGTSAGVTVGDFNNDGWSDLFFTNSRQGELNYLYRNNKDGTFTNVTVEMGLGDDKNTPGVATTAVFIDYDNDGWRDLYVARIGCHSLYRNINGHSFVDVSKETGISKVCYFTASLNVFDMDKDGYNDIYIGNSKNKPGITDVKQHIEMVGKSGGNRDGGRNLLLKNDQGKFFNDVSQKYGVDDSGHTWAVGIGDFNNDGYPDIFLANDFGPDKLFFNKDGMGFTDVTKQALGLQRGRASMSASVGDFNNDGYSDIYVSNITEAGFSVGLNSMYKNRGNGTFKNIAIRAQTDRCGFGWGTKFFDPDRDGVLDIIAVNGLWNSGSKEYWFNYITIASLPPFIRKQPKIYPSTDGTQLAGNQRSCLFLSSGKKYFDVAKTVGLTNNLLGRGVAVFDFDNDGDQDLVISNVNNRPLLYRNDISNKYNWIGFELHGNVSNREGIGARVVVKTNKMKITRDLYPGNGYNSQSERRLFVGLGKFDIEEVKLIWPSGIEQKINDYELNTYNRIVERNSRP